MPGPFSSGFSLGFGYGLPVVLSTYQQFLQLLLHDPNGTYFPVANLTTYINVARRRVAAAGQGVRVLLSGGTITSLTLTAPGAGYVSPVVTITGNGQQAFATATQVGGVIIALNLTSGGWGYITGATVTITDSGGPGAGATATAVVDNSVSTVAGQEVYTFAQANALAQATQGVRYIIGLMSVACQWGSGNVYKPMLNPMIWSEFQAYRRSYSVSTMSYPCNWSQYGQGAAGTLYTFPIPSQVMSMDWDTWCLPVDLVDDNTIEVIPPIWEDAVPYYAAYLACLNAQRKDDAQQYLNDYTRLMKEARAQSESSFVPNYYESY